VERFFEKMGFENFGGGALHPLEFTPWGGFCPHLTFADFGPTDRDKNGFCSGGDRSPFGGDMGFGWCALWPTFYRNLTRKFWKF